MLFPCLRDRTDETEDKGKATDALGAMVAAVPGERAAAWVTLQDPNKTYSEAHRMNSVYNKMSGPTRIAGSNEDKGEATDVLGAMVAAMPVVRAAVWVL
jgi:hypothetical protein